MIGIAFTRKITEARPFELDALNAIKRPLYEIFSNRPDAADGYNEFFKNLYVSSQFLTGGNQAADLSVFFQSISFGGSGGTYTYVLALKRLGVAYRSFGVIFDMSENGRLFNDRPGTGPGYSTIIAEDKSLSYRAEFSFDEGVQGYLQSTIAADTFDVA